MPNNNGKAVIGDDVELKGSVAHYQGISYNLSDEKQYEELVDALMDNGLEAIVDMLEVIMSMRGLRD